MAEGESDELARQQLEEVFRPLFELHHDEAGGIPLRELRRKLHEEGLQRHIPAEKLELLIRRADMDQDGVLSYEEFVHVATETRSGIVEHHQLGLFKMTLQSAASSVVPKSSRYRNGENVLQKYLSHYTCCPPPLFFLLLSILQVSIFCYYAVALAESSHHVTAISGFEPNSPLIYNPARRYEVWRFCSYMLLHAGYMHLFSNLIFQLGLGLLLEMVHGWWRVAAVFSLGVVAGSLAHSISDANTMLVGSSGGCYALIGAHFAIVIMNWKEMTDGWLSHPIKFLLSAPTRLIIFGTIVICDVALTIWRRYDGSLDATIGYAAHFGGACAGLLIGLPVLKNLNENPWEKVVYKVALALSIFVAIFAIFWNIFYPGFPPTDWTSCCSGSQ